jgi:hypothetical protein
MLLQPVLFVENPTTDNDPKVSHYERANQLTSRPNGVSRTATTVTKTQAGTDRALERRASARQYRQQGGIASDRHSGVRAHKIRISAKKTVAVSHF